MSQFIQVPMKLLKDEKLHPNSKLLLGLIVSLNNAEYGCIIENQTLSKIFNVDVRTIQRYLEELKLNKLIAIDEIPRTNERKGNIRIIVATEKAMTTSIKKAKLNVIKAQNQWNIKNKNLLPRDIESDWLDDYIAKTR